MPIPRVQHGLAAALVLTLASAALAAPPHASPPAKPAPARIDFARDVLPILSDNCFHCHGPDEQKREADLRLDTREGAFTAKGVLVVGHSARSELFKRITAADADDLMPPPDSNRKLTPQQVAVIRRWIDEGAGWSKHWAFVPPVRPAAPPVKQTRWPRNGIDYFVLARLETQGLLPSDEAPRPTLIRRLSLDLTGLPPTPEEFEAFLADTSEHAYEKLVDRLLASPRYGERMVWDWLDAARYADTNGYQGDPTRTMWPWRDWVVKALNDNMPYDRFTIEQLAGDLLPEATIEQKIATGFNRNHMHNGEGGRIAEETRVENVMDRTETTATIWLGLTFTCCRCHDHKYDPLTLRDYYGMYAYFNQMSEAGQGRGGQAPPFVEVSDPQQRDRLKAVDAQLKDAADKLQAMEREILPRDEQGKLQDSPIVQKLPGNVLGTLAQPPQRRYLPSFEEIIPVLRASHPQYVAAVRRFLTATKLRETATLNVARVMVMDQLAKPRDTFILNKGAYDKPGEKVQPTVPASLHPLRPGAPANRLALARWLVDPANPLTARVTVNRYWQMFLGAGLVKTAEDFGVQGERPSHPELLDYLATEFVRSGWNVKALHKLIVMSAAYRQSSRVSPRLLEADPENRLLARGPRFRMPSWMLRDQALLASGLLHETLGGPPVRPYQPEGIWEEATFGKITYKQDTGPSLYRRSLYIFWRRIVGPTMFFDTAARQVCTVKTLRTNSPLHALVTLNDTTYVEAARAMARRVMLAAATDEARLDLAMRLALARRPSAAETPILLNRLQTLTSQYRGDANAALKLLRVGDSPVDPRLDPVEHAAWTGVCSLILNLDETLTKP